MSKGRYLKLLLACALEQQIREAEFTRLQLQQAAATSIVIQLIDLFVLCLMLWCMIPLPEAVTADDRVHCMAGTMQAYEAVEELIEQRQRRTAVAILAAWSRAAHGRRRAGELAAGRRFRLAVHTLQAWLQAVANAREKVRRGWETLSALRLPLVRTRLLATLLQGAAAVCGRLTVNENLR